MYYLEKCFGPNSMKRFYYSFKERLMRLTVSNGIVSTSEYTKRMVDTLRKGCLKERT